MNLVPSLGETMVLKDQELVTMMEPLERSWTEARPEKTGTLPLVQLKLKLSKLS